MKIPGVLEKSIKKRLGKIHKYPKRLLNSFPNLLKSNEKEFALMKKISLTEKNKRKEAKQKKKNNIKKTKQIFTKSFFYAIKCKLDVKN